MKIVSLRRTQRKGAVGKFVTRKASDFQEVQLPSTNELQQIQ